MFETSMLTSRCGEKIAGQHLIMSDADHPSACVLTPQIRHQQNWLVVWNMFFHILGNIGNNSPNLLLFFRGVEKNRNICARTLVFAGPGMMWVWTISIPADKWINSKSGLLLVSLPADGHWNWTLNWTNSVRTINFLLEIGLFGFSCQIPTVQENYGRKIHQSMPPHASTCLHMPPHASTCLQHFQSWPLSPTKFEMIWWL